MYATFHEWWRTSHTDAPLPCRDGHGALFLDREYEQYCHVGSTAKQCRVGLFEDSDFARDLEDSKSSSGGTMCVFGSHTFVPKSWMWKKQTSVTHSSTESEIISSI